VNFRVGWLAKDVLVKPPSHTGDGVGETTLAMARCCCRVMLAMVLPSHAGDGIIESCWQWQCRGDVSCGAMSLRSHAGDVATESC
jgi:hypothetical protein